MKIEVHGAWGDVIKAQDEGDDSVVLAWEGEYRKDDYIEFKGLEKGAFYELKVDPTIEESLIFVTTDSFRYTIPFYEKKTSYNPMSFVGNRHLVSIRKAYDHEIRAYRNLCLNPCDQHEVTGVYPHASANVETRGEAVFAARNAIDGVIETRSHGEWPYESWGINRQDDATIKIDFGYPVDIEEIRLYTRADFPHDNWWIRGTFKFSDGSTETVDMDKKVQKPHIFNINKKNIEWLTLGDLIKADDPSPFPALTQIEVYGIPAVDRGN